MRLSALINTKTKHKLLQLKKDLKAQEIEDKTPQEYYLQEIAEIRKLSKYKLVKYIEQKRNVKSVKLALKIAHSSSAKMYRMLDSKVKYDVELLNYARNRLYASS